MQTVSTQRSAVSGVTVRPTSAVRAAAPCRAVVVRAAAAESAESRRAVLAGLLAAAGLAAAPRRAGAVEIKDDRVVRDRGFDLIYEARDLDLPQSTRDGFTQAREGLDSTKKRVSESEKRIDATLDGLVSKKYWTAAREELRLQVGTLRFDLNALADTLDKPSRKKALSLKADFLKKAESLDFAMRKKDPASASKLLAETKTALDAVVAAVA